MKNTYMKHIGKFACALLLPIALLSSCKIDDAANINPVKLGASLKTYVANADGATINIPVYSNNPYHVEMIDGQADWMYMKLPKDLSQNGYISIECAFNNEFKRMTRFVLCSDVDTRRDTVTIKQKGLMEAYISKEDLSVVLEGSQAGTTQDYVYTNIPFNYMTVTRKYAEDSSDTTWLKSVEIVDSELEKRELRLTADANPSLDKPRTCQLTFSYKDGWGDVVSLKLNAVQMTKDNKLGSLISMAGLKQEYPSGTIGDYVIIEGIVISAGAPDYSAGTGGNAGENEQKTTSNIDYTGCERTVYLEALDGSTGVCLTYDTTDDKLPPMYSKVQYLLYGATGKLKSEPARYDITGVKGSMVVAQTSGSRSDVPQKSKAIKDLTDNDIYTYVSLHDVEFPVRKGGLTPFNEGYTLATNAHRISKCPCLLRDINGDWLYVLTNTTCAYRRDGTCLPYGSGSVSGVIVHERFPRFEWRNLADPTEMEEDPTLGRIGTYQIRHQVKGDIWDNMKTDQADGFSQILVEYRYWYPDATNGVCLSNYKHPVLGQNGWITHTWQTKYTGSSAKSYTNIEFFNQHFKEASDYSYLGPIGTNKNYRFGQHLGNRNGLGIKMGANDVYSPTLSDLYDASRKEWAGPTASSPYASFNGDETDYTQQCPNMTANKNMAGKGTSMSYILDAFAASDWWDPSTGRGYGWLVKFSTKGISSMCSLQISMLNTEQSTAGAYTPRFWKAEWAFTDAQDAASDSQWHLIGEFTVPDVSQWSNTLYSSIVAFKPMNFQLPLEILGHDPVYIRIIPTSDLCSNGFDYADAHYGDATSTSGVVTHNSTLNYFAIRYNK